MRFLEELWKVHFYPENKREKQTFNRLEHKYKEGVRGNLVVWGFLRCNV